ncbi:MAG: hypothetical protein ACRENE_34090 [Polyangiaceae bacterium]
MTPRRVVAAGAVATVLGIAVAGTAPVFGTGADGRAQTQQTMGGIVVLAGWALLAWGIHRLGRER